MITWITALLRSHVEEARVNCVARAQRLVETAECLVIFTDPLFTHWVKDARANAPAREKDNLLIIELNEEEYPLWHHHEQYAEQVLDHNWLYLLLLHSKPHWIQQVLQRNPFQTDHFGWIDFDCPTSLLNTKPIDDHKKDVVQIHLKRFIHRSEFEQDKTAFYIQQSSSPNQRVESIRLMLGPKSAMSLVSQSLIDDWQYLQLNQCLSTSDQIQLSTLIALHNEWFHFHYIEQEQEQQQPFVLLTHEQGLVLKRDVLDKARQFDQHDVAAQSSLLLMQLAESSANRFECTVIFHIFYARFLSCYYLNQRTDSAEALMRLFTLARRNALLRELIVRYNRQYVIDNASYLQNQEVNRALDQLIHGHSTSWSLDQVAQINLQDASILWLIDNKTSVYPALDNSNGIQYIDCCCTGLNRLRAQGIAIESALQRSDQEGQFVPFLLLDTVARPIRQGQSKCSWTVLSFPAHADALYLGIANQALHSTADQIDSQQPVRRFRSHVEQLPRLFRILNMVCHHAVLILTPTFARAYQRSLIEMMSRQPNQQVNCIATRLQQHFQVYALDDPLFYDVQNSSGTQIKWIEEFDTLSIEEFERINSQHIQVASAVSVLPAPTIIRQEEMKIAINRHHDPELEQQPTVLFACSYSIPEDKIVPTVPTKTQDYASLIPGQQETYRFGAHQEQDYRNMYSIARFAYTHKKGGWDALRHYEILGCGTIPLFTDLANCPIDSLTHYPKALIQEANRLLIPWTNSEEQQQQYTKYSQQLLDYTRRYLGCTASARRFLSNLFVSHHYRNNRNSPKVLMLVGHLGVNYTRELLIIGLRRLLGSKFIEYPRYDVLYTDCPESMRASSYGFGYTYSGLLEPIDRRAVQNDEQVRNSILNHDWDLIIYGKVGQDEPNGSIPLLQFWSEVSQVYSKQEIVFLYGGDAQQDLANTQSIHTIHLQRHLQYGNCAVRELANLTTSTNLLTNNPSSSNNNVQEHRYLVIEYQANTWNGGLGDRLLGLASAISLANYSRRRLLIKWDEPRIDHCIDYQKYNYYECKEAIQSTSRILVDVMNSNAQSFMSNQSNQSFDYPDQVVILRTNQEITESIYQNDAQRSYQYPQIVQCAFESIFQEYMLPKQNVLQHTVQGKNREQLGIQIRAGDCYMSGGIQFYSPDQLVHSLVPKIVAFIQQQYPDPTTVDIFLTTDFETLHHSMQQELDKLHYKLSYQAGQVIHSDRPQPQQLDGLIKTFADLIRLSQSDTLLISFHSNFGRSAALMKHRPDRPIYVLDRDCSQPIHLLQHPIAALRSKHHKGNTNVCLTVQESDQPFIIL